VELLTWQSRRVRLFAEGDAKGERVVGILLSYGDVFDAENTFFEQMSGWHVSSGKGHAGAYVPNLHRAERSVWRDLSALLPQSTIESEHNKTYESGTVRWLMYLKNKDAERTVFRKPLLDIGIIGVEYGSMKAVVDELIVDALRINADILMVRQQEWIGDWIQDIVERVTLTEKCVAALGKLASDLSEAGGNGDTRNKKGLSDAVCEEMYFQLDLPFRDWLQTIEPTNDDDRREEIFTRWDKQVRYLVLKKGEECTIEASGRLFRRRGKEVYAQFEQSVRQLLPTKKCG
jgi:CRISPR system Cascade subunit CasA